MGLNGLHGDGLQDQARVNSSLNHSPAPSSVAQPSILGTLRCTSFCLERAQHSLIGTERNTRVLQSSEASYHAFSSSTCYVRPAMKFCRELHVLLGSLGLGNTHFPENGLWPSTFSVPSSLCRARPFPYAVSYL